MKQKSTLFFFFALIFTFHIVEAQVYPYAENFNSMATFTNPSGWTSTIPGFQIYSNHGVGATNGMTKQMTTLGAAADSVISPLVGPLTAISQLSFDYRIMETNLYPAFSHALTAGEKIEFYAVSGPLTLLVSTIDMSNHSTSTSWATINVPIGSLAGNSGSLMIKVTRTNSDFFADFDNFSVTDVSVIGEVTNRKNQAFVYPNPSANSTVLKLKGVETGKYSCKLISSSSSIVLEQELIKTSDDDVSLKTGLLSEGIYLLQLTGVRNNYLLKFVVKD